MRSAESLLSDHGLRNPTANAIYPAPRNGCAFLKRMRRTRRSIDPVFSDGVDFAFGKLGSIHAEIPEKAIARPHSYAVGLGFRPGAPRGM